MDGWEGALGYDRSQGKLVINPEEFERVRLIFNLYLELGCVSKLKDRSIELQVRSKAQISKTRRRFGGVCYSRGALYQILKNRTYIGEISIVTSTIPANTKPSSREKSGIEFGCNWVVQIKVGERD